MNRKKSPGGRRNGAGRKRSFNEREEFMAWHRYNLLVQDKSLNRFGRDFFGEENWDDPDGLKKDINFIRSVGANAKSDKEKSRERTNYLLSDDYNERHLNIEACLSGRALKYQQESEGEVCRIFTINTKANGKLRAGELSQAQMYAVVAKSMSKDPRINRKITARSVERAVKAEEARRRELPEEEIIERFKSLLD
jgi:adenine-specific DNA methylase